MIMQDIMTIQRDTGCEDILTPLEDIENEDKNIYLSVDDLAKLLSIARVSAYQLTKIHDFPRFHIGKRIIIPLQSFHRWAEEQANRQSVLCER
jgi:predicted DNA-binding transcriptional regulator AlpA